MLYAHTHKNDALGPNTTFAISPPTRTDLEKCFTMHANQLMVLAGLSVASKHDNFNKRTGRELAESRAVPRIAEFDSVTIFGTKHVYNFRTKIPVGFKEYIINFQLTTVAESEEVKLIQVDVYD